jgi:hypothetical protein
MVKPSTVDGWCKKHQKNISSQLTSKWRKERPKYKWKDDVENDTGKIKGKVLSSTGHKGLEAEQKYNSSTFSSTWALDGMGV